MNFLSRIFNIYLTRISELILLFSQVISLQIAFYPLIIMGIIVNLGRFVQSKLTYVVMIFIFTIAFSAYFRDASLENILKILQFYLGILLVTIFFKINRNASIQNWLIYSFVGFVIYEVVSTNLLNILPFFYDNPEEIVYDHAVDAIGLTRAEVKLGFYRAFGPAINSSITGSILAILFYILIDKRKTNNKPPMHLILLVLFCVVICASATAFFVLSSVGILYLISKKHHYSSRLVNIFFKKFLVYFFIFLLLSTLTILIILLIDDSILISSNYYNHETILFVINQKLSEFTMFEKFSFFGRNLSTLGVTSFIGGDSLIFNSIQNIGLYGLLGLFSILMWTCEKGTRIYVIGGFIATLHYGALFTLTGQFFFAAVANNAILREN